MERRKFVIGLGSLAAGGAAATGTGAFTAAEINNRDANIAVNGDTGALIQLIPGHYDSVAGSSSTVSDNRVYLDDQNTLELSFDDSDSAGNSTTSAGDGSGINPQSVYQVGAIGEGAADYLEDTLSTTLLGEDDILYGDGVVSGGNSESTGSDPAFVMRNASDTTYTVELDWNGGAPNTSDAEAALLSDAEGLTAAGNSNQAGFGLVAATLGGNDVARFRMAPGDEAGFSLIAEVADVDPTTISDWSGSLSIDAGEITGST